MNDVESNMQEGLAHLELEARNPANPAVQRMSSVSTISSVYSPVQPTRPRDQYPAPNRQNYGSQQSSGPRGYTASYQHTNAAAYQNMGRQGGYQREDPESPTFSPFPKPRNAGPNVPYSDEEKETILELARPTVLKSTDPEEQLAWAQDALVWVETAQQYEAKLQTEGQAPRSITPKVEHSLRVDALNIVTFLAEQHHPKAEFMKGMWLEFGKFKYRLDKKEAFLCYKRAAEKGYARAEYRIGMQYENSQEAAKAIPHYQKGVALGDSASNYRLGMMIVLGQHGMTQDYQRGVDHICFSADTADENAPQGAYVYGMLLARELPNINVPEQFLPFDQNKAKEYIEKAAYLGFAKAQLKMAQAYELCQLGCEFGPALSLHYNALAARQGEAEADMAISKWFLCGYEGVFEKNEELAFTYAKRAAATKMATAEFAMGYFYEIGMYVPVDLRESEAWYQKASDHGNKDALGRINSIKSNNTLTKNDHQKVAISRIKSTHGSQRGVRPDRFRQRQSNPMPVIADDVVDMPDPRNSYTGNGQAGLPRRPVSTAPYPEDDVAHPPSGPFNGQGLRPQSQVRPGPQADRPTSAFGIRPVSHASTGFDQGNYGGRPPQDPMRPSTSMGNMHVPAGRGQHPPAGNRVQSAGWEPQNLGGYPDSSPGRPPKLPQIDAGQPLSVSTEAGRMQKPPMNVNKAQPAQPQGYGRQSGTPVDGVPPRRDPAANHAGRPPRGSSITPSVTSPPPISAQHASQHGGYDSMHSPGHPMQSPPPASASRASQRPPQQTMSSQGRPDSPPASAAPSAAPSTASAASHGSKKTGPATFEEMGIPAGKSENDCVSITIIGVEHLLTSTQVVM